MKVAVFDTHSFECEYFRAANREFRHELVFLEPRLMPSTLALAKGFSCVCCFVNDVVDRNVLAELKSDGLKLVSLRSAGYNNVDIDEAARLGVRVTRVPAYSPHSVAEHAAALLLSLDRKIPRAYGRVRDFNFSQDGLVGYDLFGKTVGVVGTGRIGTIFARIMHGFGCRVLACDTSPDPELVAEEHVEYVSLDRLYRESDIISLHVPLTPETQHLVDRGAFEQMKSGVILINTGRGALIDTRAMIEVLKSGRVGAAGLDVYEEEENVFFEDLSGKVLQDDVLARLLTFPNVLITSHQGFLTREALAKIARTTLQNISDFEYGRVLINQILPRQTGPSQDVVGHYDLDGASYTSGYGVVVASDASKDAEIARSRSEESLESSHRI